jgi:hypothetical protein
LPAQTHASIGECGTTMLEQPGGNGNGAEQTASVPVIKQCRVSPHGEVHVQNSGGAQSSFTSQGAPVVPGGVAVTLQAKRHTPGLTVLNPSGHAVTVKSQ